MLFLIMQVENIIALTLCTIEMYSNRLTVFISIHNLLHYLWVWMCWSLVVRANMFWYFVHVFKFSLKSVTLWALCGFNLHDGSPISLNNDVWHFAVNTVVDSLHYFEKIWNWCQAAKVCNLCNLFFFFFTFYWW